MLFWMQKTDILNEGDSFTMAVGGKGFTIKGVPCEVHEQAGAWEEGCVVS